MPHHYHYYHYYIEKKIQDLILKYQFQCQYLKINVLDIFSEPFESCLQKWHIFQHFLTKGPYWGSIWRWLNQPYFYFCQFDVGLSLKTCLSYSISVLKLIHTNRCSFCLLLLLNIWTLSITINGFYLFVNCSSNVK